MEVKKYHNSPFANGRYKSVKFQRSENQRPLVQVLNLKAQEPGNLMSEGRKRWTSQLKKRVNSSLLCYFVPLRPLKD